MFRANKASEAVEVLTIDKAQGRDKDCIVVSMAFSSTDSRSARNILQDVRRLNVSVTRAKVKLVIVGSRRALEAISQMGRMFQLLKKMSWVWTLPRDADSIHNKLSEQGKRQRSEGSGYGEDLGQKKRQHKGDETMGVYFLSDMEDGM